MDAQATSWIAFGIALVTMIGGLVKAYFDKDTAIKITRLEDKVESQDKDIKACEKRHESCEEQGRIQDERIAQLERDHGPGRCIPLDPEADAATLRSMIDNDRKDHKAEHDKDHPEDRPKGCSQS